MEKKSRYFTPKIFTRISFLMGHGLIKYYRKARLIDKVFKKEIMLTVSSVNACAICSHVHTKSLLKDGVELSELEDLYAHVSSEKRVAIVFAEHYADNSGQYEQEAFLKVINYYGKDKAYGIMTIIQMIMFGNANGIALTNLANRLRFKRNKESRFMTELYNGPFAYIVLLVCLFLNLFTKRKVY